MRIGWMLPAVVLLCTPGLPTAQASPAFVVSVCLADVEYSIACWERSSLEAAKRLEQIFMDDYATGRATGSLRIWFPLNAEQGEQLRFLREVEDRAVEGAVRKMQAAVDNPASPPADFSQAPARSSDEGPADQGSADQGSADQRSADQAQLLAQLLQKQHEDIRKWREDATLEARKGTNWSHDWGARTHIYKPGPALDQLVHSSNRNRGGD